jgi:putative transposase
MLKRKPIRLSDYDYSKPGAYYVTICVHDRFENCNILGEISDGIVNLNQYGKIVNDQWLWLFKHYNYIKIDEYIVMPDHFHGIIHIVDNNNIVGNDCIVGNGYAVGNGRDLSLQANG